MKNRKTFKKLILGGLLLLTTGSLFAQTQKIHTLQVKNSSGTTTMNSDALIQMDSDNKGLLLPRIALTGANKVAPLTAHTAGMVVYNTANVPASGSGATAIEAVTEGYYYNDGTKWVKISSTDQNEWSYNPTTKQINLVRSGTAPFANKVYYDTEKGRYFNSDTETIEFFNGATVDTTPISQDNRAFALKRNASNLANILDPGGNETKELMRNTLYIDDTDVLSGTRNFRISSKANLVKGSTNSKSYDWLIASRGRVNVLGGGSDKSLAGVSGSLAYYTGSASITSYGTGGRFETWFNSTGTAKNISAVKNYISQGPRAGAIQTMRGVDISFNIMGSSTVSSGTGYSLIVNGTGTALVEDFRGFYFKGLPNTHTTNYTNAYGIWLGNIEKATNNYAIFTNRGTVRFGDNVGIGTTTVPTEKLEVVGNGKFTGTVATAGVLANSDKRFKQGIKPVTSAMQTVNKLQPVSYTWSALGKKNGGDNKKHIGFIAQEIEKVLPNLVNTDAKGYKSVNYIEVIPVLTKALQEQQKEIDELKAMVKKLLK